MKAVLRGTTRINISIGEDQKSKLEKLSERSGAPLAELVRRAIELYLKKEG